MGMIFLMVTLITFYKTKTLCNLIVIEGRNWLPDLAHGENLYGNLPV